MSLLNLICKEFNVKIGEEWLGIDGYSYRILEDSIQYRGNSGWSSKEWIDIPSKDYKRLLIGEIKPKWMQHIPQVGDGYYRVDITDEKPYYLATWTNGEADRFWLERGLVFKNEKDAKYMAQKLLEVAKQGI